MNIWQGKRVLITGHSGFKGGWLSMMLQRAGARVTGLSLPPDTEPNLLGVARIEALVESHFGDIRVAEVVDRVFAAAEPEVVFHMAAQALVRKSYTDPVETYATNVMGTVNVLEAVRRTPSVLAVVNVTSDKCYENRETARAYREDDPMGGSDPYSSSKGCAELVAAAYRKSFLGSGKLVSVRAGNVIGGGDWSADRLVPDCVRAFSKGLPVVLRNPQSLRPWQHVLEPLTGYRMVAEALLAGKELAPAYNFGPSQGQAQPVGMVVRAVAKCWGSESAWEQDSQPSPPEAKVLGLDSTLARTGLGWKPRLSLEECIAWTVEWYKRHLAGEDMCRFTGEQIDGYQVR